MKKLTAFLAVVLSFIVYLSGVSPALAQVAEPPSRGITTLYATPEQQKGGVELYGKILKGYVIAIPNPDQSAMLPPDLASFPAAFKQVLEMGRKQNGTNGSFTEGWFDFQAAVAVTPGTNQLFTVNAPIAPVNSRLYTVVAGVPVANLCPLKIQSTEIYFFDAKKEAIAKAQELSKKNYLVYVSPDDDSTISAFSNIFYDQKTGKKKDNPECFLVSGATEKIKVDFTDIFYLLPPTLQQPAHLAAFEFAPRVDDFIYLVNARKTLK